MFKKNPKQKQQQKKQMYVYSLLVYSECSLVIGVWQ